MLLIFEMKSFNLNILNHKFIVSLNKFNQI